MRKATLPSLKRQMSSKLQASIRPLCILGLVCAAVFFASPLFANATEDSTTTFVVVRHAEREGNLDKLTRRGEERAQQLSALGRVLNVQAIYSTDTNRTKGTAQPLAAASKIEIQTYGRLSRDWIASLKEKHAGQVVLIIGHSNTTGVIAGLLASEKPAKIEHDEYDALFIVQVSQSATRSLRLRYGGTSKGAAFADPDKMGASNPAQESK